jgi:uncharacterized protein
MQWYNEPATWDDSDGKITVTADAKTDFWRKTHNGVINNNGHFYFTPVDGDFTVEVRVTGQYGALYDQAGLMIRLDDTTWMKCGIEYMNGVQHVSAVITRDTSDWSIIVLPENTPSIWVRVIRYGGTVEVYYSLDGVEFSMYRQGWLSDSARLEVGLLVAAPIGDGFPAAFEGFKVTNT